MPTRHASTGEFRWPLLAGNFENYTDQSTFNGRPALPH
jgi:hypothetical protein